MKYLMQYQAWIPNKVRGIMNTSLYKKRNLMLFLFFSMIFQGINMKLKQVPRTKLETLIGSGVFPHITAYLFQTVKWILRSWSSFANFNRI